MFENLVEDGELTLLQLVRKTNKEEEEGEDDDDDDDDDNDDGGDDKLLLLTHLISSQDHCQRSPPLRISDMSRAEFETGPEPEFSLS